MIFSFNSMQTSRHSWDVFKYFQRNFYWLSLGWLLSLWFRVTHATIECGCITHYPLSYTLFACEMRSSRYVTEQLCCRQHECRHQASRCMSCERISFVTRNNLNHGREFCYYITQFWQLPLVLIAFKKTHLVYVFG